LPVLSGRRGIHTKLDRETSGDVQIYVENAMTNQGAPKCECRHPAICYKLGCAKTFTAETPDPKPQAEREARQFWLSFDGAVGDQGFVHYENPNYDSQIHVIEKSAYDAALAQCEKLAMHMQLLLGYCSGYPDNERLLSVADCLKTALAEYRKGGASPESQSEADPLNSTKKER
jgi:hypothetical protein